jgi:hypothetical protein
MAQVKTKKEFEAMTTPDFIKYIDSLPLETFRGYVGIDEKIRYFLGKYGKTFAEYLKGTNIFFDGAISQSMYESTYGKSDVAVNGNNFAGLYYNPNFHNDYWIAKNGKKWAKFPTADEGIKNHIDSLLAKRYKDARDTTKSPEEQIKKFVESGYAQGMSSKLYLKRMQGILNRVRKLTGLGRISN